MPLNNTDWKIAFAVPAHRRELWIDKVLALAANRAPTLIKVELKNRICFLPQNCRRYALKAIATFDSAVFRVEIDPISQGTSEPKVANIISSEVKWNGSAWKIASTFQAALLLLDLDILVWLIDGAPDESILKIAKRGVWRYQYGRSDKSSTAGFPEVLMRQFLVKTRLIQNRYGVPIPQLLYISHSGIDRESLSRTRAHLLLQSAEFISRVLSNSCEQPRANILPGAAPQKVIPWGGAGQVLRHGVQTFVRRCRKRIREQWILGYSFNCPQAVIPALPPKLSEIIPPDDRSWIDPFPVSYNGKYYIFTEELVFSETRGKIIVMELRPDGSRSSPVVALERPYHLSYPFIFKWRTEYYMVPETAEVDRIELYRCTCWPRSWERVAVLMENVRAVDTTLVEMDGLWYLFTTIGGKGVRCTDELFVFTAKNPLGSWIPMKNNPVLSDVRYGRSAGRIGCLDGVLFRPAQDCSRRYGGAITIRKISEISATRFEEEEHSRIGPTWRSGLIATHTINQSLDLTLVDGCQIIPV